MWSSEAYREHLQSFYWGEVRLTLRHRATDCDGVTRCENCEEPLKAWEGQCHHTKIGYRYVGSELDHLEHMRFWCRKCHAKFHNK
jgi:hypothetical protein